MNVHLVRHAECFKNIIGIPGGEGAPLTPAGLIQADTVGKSLRLRLVENATLIACPPRQTVETASIIGKHLGIGSKVEPLFTSVGLGVLDGVPVSDAKVRFPASSAAMDRWRSRSSEIADLQIDGLENPWEFYNRGLLGILKYRACDQLILCATTSIMILISHISDKITPRSGEGYKSLDFTNGEVVDVEFDNYHLDWIEEVALS
jgi:broad specificity phosphatase PhoE